jgi:hypothetical protein
MASSALASFAALLPSWEPAPLLLSCDDGWFGWLLDLASSEFFWSPLWLLSGFASAPAFSLSCLLSP